MFVGEKYLNHFFQKLHALYNDCRCFSRGIIIIHLAKNIAQLMDQPRTGRFLTYFLRQRQRSETSLTIALHCLMSYCYDGL